ncbi:hypothetical protein AB0O42_27515 [Streptomyces sp. NPDC089922]|uniref:hypothetical protein n=1 Tax=unclassified Streptomyces TaxID=2593676 RepID=UPI00342E4F1D
MAALSLSSRDVLRFAFAQGAGNALVTTPIRVTEHPVSTAGTLPPGTLADRRTPLPPGTHEHLEDLPYPRRGAAPTLPDTPAAPDAAAVAEAAPGEPHRRLGHALVAAFGIQRREPSNPYNDHRGHASVRSKFPVHAFVTAGGRRHLVDPGRHALLEMAGRGAPDEPAAVVLAGRFTHLPDYYRPLRGPLTELELGINLRALAVGMELFGVPGALRLPDADATGTLQAGLGLAPAWQWTLPLVVETPQSATQPPAPALPTPPATATASPGEESAPDPALAEVVAVNRTQRTGGPAVPLTAAVPDLPGERGPSWAQVLFERTAGRMPRRLSGMNGRRCRVPATALTDAAAWLALPPPGLLRAVADAIRVTAVVQDVDGFADGRYTVRDSRIAPRDTTDPGLPARLERAYGYPLTPGNGCDVRHATTLWFLTARPARLVEEFGPAGWTLAQYAAGWMTQGLSLSAAAHGLYARPARAFDEIPAQRLLGLEPDETVLLSVISGTNRFTEQVWDVRL